MPQRDIEGYPRETAHHTMHFYRRNLPHIEKFNASYFVNFPRWELHTATSDEIDCILKHCLFENGKRIELHACVVMPTHVHLLFTALGNESGEPFSLAEIMKGIKGSSARNINKRLGRREQLWEDESFDRIMRPEDFRTSSSTSLQNPINAGLTLGPDEYRWAWTRMSHSQGRLRSTSHLPPA